MGADDRISADAARVVIGVRGNDSRTDHGKKEKNYSPKFVKAENINVGDYTLTPIDKWCELENINADMEFSLKLRQAQGRLWQMDLPLEQARHHGYYDTDPEYRETQSKKTYDRILDRFRGKNEILVARR